MEQEIFLNVHKTDGEKRPSFYDPLESEYAKRIRIKVPYGEDSYKL